MHDEYTWRTAYLQEEILDRRHSAFDVRRETGLEGKSKTLAVVLDVAGELVELILDLIF